jgi:hypothetical protein
MKNPWMLLLGLLALDAQAASYCKPAALIQVTDCEDNDAFIHEGDNCLTKLENAVKAASLAMTKGFSKNDQQKQAKKFNSALRDNAVSSATLAGLMATADQAIADVKSYQAALEEPEDADEPEVTQGNPEAYKMSVDCYGDTKHSLEGIVADIEHVKHDLASAKQAADANAAASGTRERQVDNSSSTKIIRGQGKPAALPKGTPKNRDSDVSGTVEPKK